MLKFLLADKRGVISWLLSQIGLLLATGILLASIASLTFYSDWQKEAEAKVMASNFATAIESMYLKEFPGKTTYLFPIPEKNYYYEVFLSTDYIAVKRNDGTINKEIIAREEFLIHPWPNPKLLNEKGAEGFYEYLESLWGPGHDGSSPDKKVSVSLIEEKFDETRRELAKHPFRLDIYKPVYIEKVFVYTDEGRKEYVLVYQ